ncbi:hypothetical protein M413DRAFT_12060 [Hebeloma cylindrosporum]|uniref:Uncharacterized protein n=1 Tax=Hebeloma cylindrosporum TaxID=76867 RepID=A0A0C2YEG6_HEBCY|nr:hypothetical protein M413DRAFT_12060 [Hebeloma cylindrosporum h7]
MSISLAIAFSLRLKKGHEARGDVNSGWVIPGIKHFHLLTASFFYAMESLGVDFSNNPQWPVPHVGRRTGFHEPNAPSHTGLNTHPSVVLHDLDLTQSTVIQEEFSQGEPQTWSSILGFPASHLISLANKEGDVYEELNEGQSQGLDIWRRISCKLTVLLTRPLQLPPSVVPPSPIEDLNYDTLLGDSAIFPSCAMYTYAWRIRISNTFRYLQSPPSSVGPSARLKGLLYLP